MQCVFLKELFVRFGLMKSVESFLIYHKACCLLSGSGGVQSQRPDGPQKEAEGDKENAGKESQTGKAEQECGFGR